MNGVLLITFVLACPIRVDGKKLYEFLAVTKVGAPCVGPSLWLPPGARLKPARGLFDRVQLAQHTWLLVLRAPSLCGIMTAQFCSIYSVSTSWKRKTRRIKLAISRQAVYDVMQFHTDPYFVADPNTFPAFGWLGNFDYSAQNPGFL